MLIFTFNMDFSSNKRIKIFKLFLEFIRLLEFKIITLFHIRK